MDSTRMRKYLQSIALFLSAGALFAAASTWLWVAVELVHSLGHVEEHRKSVVALLFDDHSEAPIVLPLLVVVLVVQLSWRRLAGP